MFFRGHWEYFWVYILKRPTTLHSWLPGGLPERATGGQKNSKIGAPIIEDLLSYNYIVDLVLKNRDSSLTLVKGGIYHFSFLFFTKVSKSKLYCSGKAHKILPHKYTQKDQRKPSNIFFLLHLCKKNPQFTCCQNFFQEKWWLILCIEYSMKHLFWKKVIHAKYI